ncbi:MAG: FAD:protein FMN transferase [Kiritimatiellales bacterium]
MKKIKKSFGKENRNRFSVNGKTGNMRVRAVLLAVAVLLGMFFFMSRRHSDSTSAGIETRSWEAMGTIVSLSLCEADQNRKEALFKQAIHRVDDIEKILSSYIPTSELSRLNGLPVGEKMHVSRELRDAVSAGKSWYGKTGGAFDITIDPLIRLWKKAGEIQKVPTETELKAVRDEMGVDKLVLCKDDLVIMKKAAVEINAGGLGKGFTADDIACLLQKCGVTSALIAMAGDVHVLGFRPDGRLWHVGVQDPRYPDNPDAVVTAVQLSDMAISTSGNYRRFVTIAGKQYSHIIDPRTGHTAENAPSVTVIGPNTLTTDILGTALSVLGVEEGLKLVESMNGIEALFITVDASDKLTLTRSRGFSGYENPAGVKEKISN